MPSDWRAAVSIPEFVPIGFEDHYLGGGTKPGALLLGEVMEYGRNARLAADMDVGEFSPHAVQQGSRRDSLASRKSLLD